MKKTTTVLLAFAMAFFMIHSSFAADPINQEELAVPGIDDTDYSKIERDPYYLKHGFGGAREATEEQIKESKRQIDKDAIRTELMNMPSFKDQKGEFRLGHFIPIYQLNGGNLQLIEDSVQYPIYQNGKMKYMAVLSDLSNERMLSIYQTYIVDPLADYVEEGNQEFFLVQLPTALYAVSEGKAQIITLTKGVTADIEAMRDRVEYMEDARITQAYGNFLEESKKREVGKSSYAVIKKAAEDFGIPFIERLLKESRIEFLYNKDMKNFSSLPIIFNNASSSQTAVRQYKVVRGDSLWRIADRFLGKGSRYPEIKKANGLKSNVIHPGQVLKIPER